MPARTLTSARSVGRPRAATRRRVRVLLLACLTTLPGATFAQHLADDAQLTDGTHPARFLDDLHSAGAWRAGVEPDRQGRVRLAAGASVSFEVRAGGCLHLQHVDEHGDGDRAGHGANPQLLIGQGRGLALGAAFEAGPDGLLHWRNDRPEPVTVTLAQAATASPATLRIELLRVESVPDPWPYLHTLTGDGGTPRDVTPFGGAGAERGVEVAAGELWTTRVEGPDRLLFRHRARVEATRSGGVAEWHLRVALDAAPSDTHIWRARARIDTSPPRIDGAPASLSSERTAVLEVPAGRHEIRVTPSADVLLQVQGLQPGVPGAAPVPEEISQRPGDGDPFAIAPPDLGAAIDGADASLANAVAALGRLAEDPDFAPHLQPAVERILAVRGRSRAAPATLEGIARAFDDAHGRWLPLDQRAAAPAPLRRTPWVAPEAAADDRRRPDPLAADAALAALVAGAPVGVFTEVDGSLELRRRHPEAAGRLRVVMLEPAGAVRFRLDTRSGSHELRALAVPVGSTPPLAERARSALLSVQTPLAAQAQVEALGGSLFLSPARVLEFEVAAGTELLTLTALDGSAWIAVEERVRRTPDGDLPLRRALVDAIGGPASARARVAALATGAAPQSTGALARFDALNAPLAAWLAARRARFADRTTPRPAVDGQPSTPTPELSAGADPAERAAAAMRVLDERRDPDQRRAALTSLLEALDAAREPFLLELTLRGAIVHEQDEALRAWAAERYAQAARARADSGAVVSLDATRFVAAPDGARAHRLVESLIADQDADRAIEVLALTEPDEDLQRALAELTTLPDDPLEGTGAIDAGPRTTAAEVRRRLLAGDAQGAIALREGSERIEDGLRLRAELERAEGRQDRWEHWYASTPGPWRWRSAMESVRAAAAARRLTNVHTGAGLAVTRLDAGAPVLIHGAWPGPVRLTLLPVHGAADDAPRRLAGRVAARHADGRQAVFTYAGNEPSTTFVAADGARPGAIVHMELPDPGPWTLSTATGPVDLAVEQWRPMVAEPLLPAPVPANASLLHEATALGREPDQGRSPRLPWRSAGPGWRPLAAAPSPALPDGPFPGGAALALPTPAGAEGGAVALFSGTPSLTTLVAADADDLEAARSRAAALLALGPSADAEQARRYGLALALLERHPDDADLRAIVARIEAQGTWQRLELVDASAGVMTASRPARTEAAEGTRMRAALLDMPQEAQRALHGDRSIRFDSASNRPQTLVVELTSVRPAYLAPQGARVAIRVDDRTEIVELAPGARVTRRLPLAAGNVRTTLALENPHPDAWVAVTLREASADGTLRTPEWNIGERYHVATADEPVVVSLEGPGVLRIVRADAGRPVYRHIETGLQTLRLEAADADADAETLYRLHLYRPRPSAGDAGTLAARGQAASPKATRSLAAPPAPAGRPGAHPAAFAAWSAGLEWTTRNPLEDDVAGTREESFTELHLTRRRAAARSADWSRTHLGLRARDSGRPVLNLDQRFEHGFAQRGLSGFAQVGAFVQQQERADGGSDAWETALNLRGGLRQERRLSARSSHTPALTLFARRLSLDDTTGLRAGTTDQDLFTRFKGDHRFGYALEDRWRFDVDRATRLLARAGAQSNEDGGIDRLEADLGVDRLFRNTSVRLEYRWRHFRADDDRRSESTAQRIAVDANWWNFDSRWRHWRLQGSATLDLDSQTLNAGLTLTRQFSTGRGLIDFAPPELSFRTQLRQQLAREAEAP
ncbi:MAG TPA: hypothetical protein VLA56_03405 [Pseudomonadales bacterium]|nr:hypothetical protein [Pseudomonadales bacterium]